MTEANNREIERKKERKKKGQFRKTVTKIENKKTDRCAKAERERGWTYTQRPTFMGNTTGI